MPWSMPRMAHVRLGLFSQEHLLPGRRSPLPIYKLTLWRLQCPLRVESGPLRVLQSPVRPRK